MSYKFVSRGREHNAVRLETAGSDRDHYGIYYQLRTRTWGKVKTRVLYFAGYTDEDGRISLQVGPRIVKGRIVEVADEVTA